MVLESTMIILDNSDYQRNGDYLPTRLTAQKDGINLVCLTKLRSNPENNVGLLTMGSSVEVLVTLTGDVGRILSKMHLVQPNGNQPNIVTGIRIAHLVLKHRQGKNHKMRIVMFVGSPLEVDKAEMEKLAKRLKKEKVNVDIVSFGDHQKNNDVLTSFINTLNGKDGTGSHLVSVPRGSQLQEALVSSPIIQGEDGMGAGIGGAGFEFGVDPNEDPELALALRVSMEEQRQRQEDEQRRAQAASAQDTETTAPAVAASTATPTSDEAMLERALALSTETPTDEAMPDFANMTEEEQIAFAMQMSMQDAQEPITQQAKRPKKDDSAMDVDEDYNEVITDPAFLQSVLENLPGVDPQSEAIRGAVDSLNKDKKSDKDKDGKSGGSK